MDSSSDNDSLTGADDTGGLSELDDTDKASVIGQHKRVSKVDDAVKTEAYEERMITSDTVGRSSCQKDEKENDDPSSQPMLERAVKGFTAERLLGIIVGEDTPDEKVCKRVPRGVRHHAAFVVDTTSLEADIVSYGDDNGSWTGHSKPRRKYCIEVEDDTGMLTAEEYQGELGDIQHLDNNIYTLCRNYFRHAHTPEFRKMC